MLWFTGAVSRCEDHFLKITFHPFCSDTWSTRPSVAGLFVLDLCSLQQFPGSKGCLLMSCILHGRRSHSSYLITLKHALAAGCTTCSTFLICSTTSYSFSALLYLIRIDPVPPNNEIMTGTGWLLLLVLSASWPSARASEWESLLTQMWPTFECKGLLVLIEYPHGL